MKTKTVTFKLKGKDIKYDIFTFESFKEAQSLLQGELLSVINLGQAVYAKAMATGKDPFKKRKRFYKLDSSKLDEVTIQKIMDLGALKP